MQFRHHWILDILEIEAPTETVPATIFDLEASLFILRTVASFLNTRVGATLMWERNGTGHVVCPRGLSLVWSTLLQQPPQWFEISGAKNISLVSSLSS
jgi:hypothetical protein